MRWFWLGAAGLLASCGGDGGDNGAFCAAVEQSAEVVDAGRGDPGSMDELEDLIDLLDAIEETLRAEAPTSIRDDVENLFEIDSDTTRASDQDQLAGSRAKVNDYIRHECDLTITL